MSRQRRASDKRLNTLIDKQNKARLDEEYETFRAVLASRVLLEIGRCSVYEYRTVRKVYEACQSLDKTVAALYKGNKLGLGDEGLLDRLGIL